MIRSPEHIVRNVSVSVATVAASLYVLTSHDAGSNQIQAEPGTGVCTPGKDLLTPDTPFANFPDRIGRAIFNTLIVNPTYGAYIQIGKDGIWRQIPCPETFPIKLVPQGYGSAISVFGNPDITEKPSYLLHPQSIEVGYGVRVLGRIYGSHPYGRIPVIGEDGYIYFGGEWILLADSNGDPLYPTNGRVLRQNEGAYFVNANNVIVRKD